ncbi:zinc finger FYVE domain-containing protein 9 [Drosophila mauritiana]|uniref:Zinc finger FYVE domain-containing protein n=1 Tax=Drosophila mauritiana TaxID=7226 RepID=A0A6P8JWB5_DROMA|nr:zinc finger FYVE domain-containing protein 9 [Drosophila mauritiana]XP_033156824.1 zinc finger FYVE domain-containing protein 9 [Drosophila mauritiana]
MDLVDIDQVLDNLELRIAADEQLSRNAAAAAAAAANSGRFLGDGASASNSGVGAGAGVSGAAGVTPTPASGKSFVGVSQVFNSLDDYRENVKSLQVDAQLPSYDWQTEAEHEDDIHKFSEQASKNNGQAIVSSSESLTTSSCSTFSSGPSPVSNGSHSEELPTPPEDEKTSEVQVEPKEQDQPQEQINHEDQHQDQAVPEPMQSKQTVEELAVGLSSISITASGTESQSLLPEEVTASSALGQVLEELSEESSPSREPETEMTNGIDVPLANLQASVAEVPVPKEKEQPVQTEEEDVELPQEQHPRRSQPLTFCSTMDEISDTELDSMLQEMDADDNQVGDQRMPEDEKSGSVSPVTEEESVRILSDEQETTSNDQMNVDNFSQASTVEFADLKQPESTPVTAMGEDVASSFSSTESDSLSGRKLDGEEEQEVDREHEDASLATDALETQEQRPQRPQTLNLNGCQAESSTPSQDENPEIQQEASQPAEVSEGAAGVGVIPGEDDEESPIYEAVGYSDPHANLGKVPPIWVPDNMAGQCMQCQQKFTMIKRRHHCRACGKVLCSVCCSQRFRLEFATEPESRVCVQCYMILSERQANGLNSESAPGSALPPTPMRSPNPNNPMEYCSTIPPHRQVASSPGAPPPSVIVPVGVLKKTDGSSSNSSSSDGQKGQRKRKSVMFSDGIAPGSELASTMEQQWGESKQARRGLSRSGSGAGQKPPTPATEEPPRSIDTSSTLGLVAQLFRGSIPPSAAAATLSATESSAGRSSSQSQAQTSPRRKAESSRNRKLPPNGDAQGCYLPPEENGLPPICISSKEGGEVDYKVVRNDGSLLDRLQNETLKFIIKNNFFVLVKIVNMSCCMNRWVLNFTTSGLHHMGSDELIILLEIKQPKQEEYVKGEVAIPKDLFQHLYEIYVEAEHARSGTHELAFTSPRNANFLGSREHGGFIFIRPTYQCLQGVIVPDNPYLVGVLIHRHEVPWAKVLPLRLILRLGAQYRYYPCPLISVRGRESVYGEIAQTIINFLVDFRNYSYSLPAIRGLYIHMEDRQTTVIIPKYRQQDVIKAINNASDHVLAFAGNFSKVADGHLVCMQNINDDRSEMYSYSTQAINIQGQPRKITGASFFVLNEALKSTSGLSGKCSIVEDGLMVQIMPAKMEEVRQALRNQNDIDIVCGPIDATDDQSEIVSIKWVDNNRDINVGVKSPIDDQPMDGISNMRVLKWASFNYSNTNYAIRLSDIYIIKCEDWYATNGGNCEEITRIAEQLARSASMALLPLLDLLAAAGINKLGLRATLDQDNVGYEAGARGSKLPPLYMNALDNHLIATLHGESSGIQEPIILELIFYILNA